MRPRVTKKAYHAYQLILFIFLAGVLVISVAWLLGLHIRHQGNSGPGTPHQNPSPSVSRTSGTPAQLMNVSAYCPCEICCGPYTDGITASGKPAVGLIVAAPPNVPFGTVLVIPGYGTAVVEDRGGAITGNKLDVLFPTHAEALEWGRRMLEVRGESK